MLLDYHFTLGISEGDNITKKLTKNHKIVIAVILVIVVTVSTAFGVKAYRDYQDKQAINSSLSHISSMDKSFTTEANQAKKLASLKGMENEYSNYMKSQKVFSEVSNKYTDEITKMKKVFIDGYDTAIAKNTLPNIDKITDKSSLNTAKTNLQNELKLITAQKDTVCDAKSLTNYNTKISTLIKAYDARIKSIEDEEAKAAAEAKAKKDAEAKAAAEAAQKAKDQQAIVSKSGTASGKRSGSGSTGASKSGSNNKNDGSTGGSAGNAGGSGGSGYMTLPNGVKIPYGWVRRVWATDTNGNKIPGSDVFFYSDGTTIGYDGTKDNSNNW